jgi:hypothetical protein
MNAWRKILELDSERMVTAGSPDALRGAIRRGTDLRIDTEFRHNGHLEPGSPNHEIVREVSGFRVTCLVGGRWAAGIMNLRLPIVPPTGFGPRASMSFVLDTTERRIFCAGAQPVVRVKPAIPMRYESRGWDFGWLMRARTARSRAGCATRTH